MNQFKHFASVLRRAAVIAVLVTAPMIGHAQPATTTTTSSSTTAASNDVCTSFASRAALMSSTSTSTAPATSSGCGTTTTGTGGSTANQTMILSDIYNFIKTTVTGGTPTGCPTTTTTTSTTQQGATQKLYSAFINNSDYQMAVNGAFILMVLFYGVGFTIGVVQPSFQEVLKRLMKMFIVFALISPDGGWDFFNQYVIGFFQDGTDDLITSIQAIGFGIPAPAGATPFYALDQMASFLIQPDTLVAIMGSAFAGGPFGLTMSGLLILAMFGFFKLIIETLRVYAITFVARALVLSVAPIFLVFLLFDKTKALFSNWLNMLLNLSLQPILLFTFLSFFLVLMQDAAKDMLGTELCWNKTSSITGTQNSITFWNFQGSTAATSVTGAQAQDANTQATNKNNSSQLGWQGSLDCLLSKSSTTGTSTSTSTTKCPSFPINIVDILSFLILVYLAQRFSYVVKNISMELSNATMNLDTGAKTALDNANQQAKIGGDNSANTPEGGQAAKQAPLLQTTRPGSHG